MASKSKFPLINIILLVAAFGGLYAAYTVSISKRPIRILPVYGDRAYNPATKDTDYHRVLNFKLVDQLNQPVTLDSFKHKVFVANFFFAACPGICKKMNSELERATKSFTGNPYVKFVSYTVDPRRDSVPVLLEYAKLHDAVPYQWYFLTGNKDSIYNLAHKSYYAEADEADGVNFVHTESMALIDTAGYIRGIYKGTDSIEVSRMIVDIHLLLKEEALGKN